MQILFKRGIAAVLALAVMSTSFSPVVALALDADVLTEGDAVITELVLEDVAEEPEAEATEAPEAEETAAPEADATEEPAAEEIAAPEADATEEPAAEETAAPEADATEAAQEDTTAAQPEEETGLEIEQVYAIGQSVTMPLVSDDAEYDPYALDTAEWVENDGTSKYIYIDNLDYEWGGGIYYYLQFDEDVAEYTSDMQNGTIQLTQDGKLVTSCNELNYVNYYWKTDYSYNHYLELSVYLAKCNDALETGVYDVTYIVGTDSFTLGTVQVVDGIVITSASAQNLTTACTSFDMYFNIYGITNLSQLDGFTVTMTNEAGETLATSSGDYKYDISSNSYSATSIYAQMIMEEGAVLSRYDSVYFTFTYDGDLTITDGVGAVSGSIYYETLDASIADLTYGDPTLGELTLTFNDIDPDTTYLVQYYYNGSYYDLYQGTITDGTLDVVAKTEATVVDFTQSSPGTFRIYLYEVDGSYTDRLDYQYFDNPYQYMSSNSTNYSLDSYYIANNTTEFDFTLTVSNMSYSYDGSVPTLHLYRSSKGIDVYATDVTVTRSGEDYIFTGTFTLPENEDNCITSGTTSLYLYFNDEYATSFTYYASAAATYAYWAQCESVSGYDDYSYNAYTMVDIAYVLVYGVGFTENATIGVVNVNDTTEKVEASVQVVRSSTSAGAVVYNVMFEKNDLAILDGDVIAIYIEENGVVSTYSRYYKLNLSELYNGVSTVFSVESLSSYDFSDWSYYYNEEDGTVSAYWYGDYDEIANVPDLIMEAYFDSLVLTPYDAVDSTRDVTVASAVRCPLEELESAYYLAYTLTFDAELESTTYYAYQNGSLVDDMDAYQSSSSGAYFYSGLSLSGGYIRGENLSVTDVYTAEIRQGYDLLATVELKYTPDSEQYYDYAYFDTSVFDELPYGMYDFIIYVNGEMSYACSVSHTSYILPPTFNVVSIVDSSWEEWDGYVIESTSLRINASNADDFSYIRVAASEEALASASWGTISSSNYRTLTLSDDTPDGALTLYAELATDTSGTGSVICEIDAYLCTDGDYDLGGTDSITGYYDYYDTFTISVTAEHQYAKAYIQFYVNDGSSEPYWDTSTEELVYVGVVDGEHTYSLDYKRYQYEGAVIKARVFLMNYNNDSSYINLDNSWYSENLRSEVVEVDLVIGELTDIILPQFSQYGTLANDSYSSDLYFSNSTDVTITGYATQYKTVTITDQDTNELLGSGSVSSNYTFSVDLTDLAEGEYALAVSDGVLDNNESTLVIDTTAPDINYIQFTFGDSNTATLKWNCVEDYLSGYVLYQIIDGEYVYLRTLSSDATSTTVTAIEDDNQRFALVAIDKAGNRTEVQKSTGDEVAPEMESLTVGDGETTVGGDSLTLSATASDDRVVDYVLFSYMLDGDATATEITKASATVTETGSNVYDASFVWDISKLVTGTYYVYATAYDLAGNASTQRSGVINIDHTAPDGVISFAATATSQYIKLTWDEDTDAASYKIVRTTTSGSGTTLTATGTSKYDTASALTYGTSYTYTITAFDAYGNESDSTTLTVVAQTDKTSATITEFAPEESAKYSTTLSVSATDNVALASAVFSYRVAGSYASWTEIATVTLAGTDATANAVWDISKITGGDYEVKVEVYDATSTEALDAGYSANAAATKTATMTIDSYNLPVSPTNFKAEAGYQSATLTWDYTGTGVISGFELYQGETLIAILTASARSYPVKDLSVTATFTLRAIDSYGEYAETSVTVTPTSADTEAPTAVLVADAAFAYEGDEITFSGASSTDNVGIVSYSWDFGEETVDYTAYTGAVAAYIYTEAGEYTVTLTVKDAKGNTSEASVLVTIWQKNANTGDNVITTTFTVVDSSLEDLPTVAGATIIITPPNLTKGDLGYYEILLTTGENGTAKTVLPSGSVDVTTYKEGYNSWTTSVTATINNGSDHAETLRLTSNEVVIASITTTEMTLDDMIEAGINVDADENQQIVLQEVTLQFVGYDDVTMETYFVDGEACYGEIEYWYDGIGVIAVSQYFYLVIYGEAQWLKEAFAVELLVLNNDYLDDLEDVVATLTLPEGLSFATMSDGVQIEEIDLGTIVNATKAAAAEGVENSASAMWYVMGDVEGEYDLTASLSGSFGGTSPFYNEYTTETPIKVYAGSALELTITAESVAYRGKDYTVLFELKNVSDKTLYNVSYDITGSKTYSSASAIADAFDDALEPGESITVTYTANDLFTNESLGITYAEYHLKDIWATTLDGSSTTIPIKFVIVDSVYSVFGKTEDVEAQSELADDELEILDYDTDVASVATAFEILEYSYIPADGDEAVVVYENLFVYMDGEASAISASDTLTLTEECTLMVQPIAAGEATLTVEYQDGRVYTETFTVAKADPTVTVPSVSAVTNSQPTLAQVALPAVASGDTAGTWSWKDESTTLSTAQSGETFTAIFTPVDTDNYNVIEAEVVVLISQITVELTIDNVTIGLVSLDEKETVALGVTTTIDGPELTIDTEWRSGDSAVATVNNGVITAVAQGTTPIYLDSCVNGVVVATNCVILTVGAGDDMTLATIEEIVSQVLVQIPTEAASMTDTELEVIPVVVTAAAALSDADKASLSAQAIETLSALFEAVNTDTLTVSASVAIDTSQVTGIEADGLGLAAASLVDGTTAVNVALDASVSLAEDVLSLTMTFDANGEAQPEVPVVVTLAVTDAFAQTLLSGETQIVHLDENGDFKGSYVYSTELTAETHTVTETADGWVVTLYVNSFDTVLGDVTGDGVVDVKDSILLLQYLAEGKVLTANEAGVADADASGVVEDADVELLLTWCI